MKKRPQPQLMNVMNVSGLAAVMFVVVVIFFMYQANATRHGHYTSVDRVIASTATDHPKADREDAMILSITHDGKVCFGSDQVSLVMLRDMIRVRTIEGSEKRLYVNADKRSRYGVVDDALRAVRPAGIEGVTFLTAQPRANTKP